MSNNMPCASAASAASAASRSLPDLPRLRPVTNTQPLSPSATPTMDFGGGGGGGGGGGASPSKKHLSALAKPKHGVSLPRGEDGRVDAKAVVTAGGWK